MKRKFKIVVFFVSTLFLVNGVVSCKKETPEEPSTTNNTPTPTSTETIPALTTSTVGNISSTTASGGGSITSNGGALITTRGICWSVTAQPTINDSISYSGSGNGFFTANMTNLTTGTTYYVRAFATNAVGTAYGNQVLFTTF